jgi:hypothetical protein
MGRRLKTFTRVEALYRDCLAEAAADSPDYAKLAVIRAELWIELLPLARAYLIRAFDRIGRTLPPRDLQDYEVDLVGKAIKKIMDSAFPVCQGRRVPVKKIRNFSGYLYWTASNVIRDRWRVDSRWAQQIALTDEMERKAAPECE